MTTFKRVLSSVGSHVSMPVETPEELAGATAHIESHFNDSYSDGQKYRARFTKADMHLRLETPFAFELFKWCNETFEDAVTVSHHFIYFNSQKDFMLFKLTWL